MEIGMFETFFFSRVPNRHEVLSYQYEQQKIDECRAMLEQAGLYSTPLFSNLALSAALECESAKKPFTDCLCETVKSYIDRRTKQ